jgi:hypothetical protein
LHRDRLVLRCLAVLCCWRGRRSAANGKVMLNKHFHKPWGFLGTENGPVWCCGLLFDDACS